MTFAEHNDVLEELSTDAAHPALGYAVLPRASVRRSRWFDAERLQRRDDLRREDGIAVEDEVSRDGVDAERLAELLDDPRSLGPSVTLKRRMRRR